ncbi:hypothetical protein HL670_00579 [Serratia plymuthica]|nr:hypothetical protein HL670_00579 [Serratia plymuthica]
MKNVLRLCLLAMSLALSLSGCDDTPIAAAATATPSPWAAVAKGYISIEGGLISIDAPAPALLKRFW